MKPLIYSLILLTVVGCQTVKDSPSANQQSTTEIVSIGIYENQSLYSAEAKWVKFDELESESKFSGNADVLTAPRVHGKPNDWIITRVVEVPEDYSTQTIIMIDGEMVKVPTGLGTTLIVKITPQENDVVKAKGILSVASKDDHFEMPFSGTFKLGEAQVVYIRTENK